MIQCSFSRESQCCQSEQFLGNRVVFEKNKLNLDKPYRVVLFSFSVLSLKTEIHLNKKSVHFTGYMYTCNICTYLTDSNSNYHKHVKTRKHIKKMNENCKKEISSLETVTQNQTICDPKKSKNLPKMRKKNILRSETDWKNKSLDRRFFETESQTCEFCGKKYSSISNFNRHLKSCPQPTENVSEYKKTLDEQYENLKKEYAHPGTIL